MPEIGKTVSHYRIMEKLGQGGMGEVFLAEDTSLDRKVALKFLPDIFSGDPERLARFEREAKLLASLNHPNIAAIFGFEQAEGKRFLVMELVEGETLAERIAKGPLPVEEALEVCRQIAEGVEAAHEKGVIHRDLKPANVKITPEGKVKVLDFGLAKVFQDETSAPDASRSPTLTDQMTRPGVIMGTAAYMAPEQAKGKAVDRRADVWAFACVLYECLAGKRVFEGETVTETLAAVLRGEPDWQALPPATPAKARELLNRCLQKDPKERLHDIADARIEINQAIREPLSSEATKGAVTARTNWRLLIPITAACLVVGAAISFLVGTRAQKQKPSPVVRFSVALPPGQKFGNGQVVLLSPDGSHMVYVANGRLFLRPMDSAEALPIQGTESGIVVGNNPFFSPDGKWIGFFAPRKLQKIPIGGGNPATLCDTPPLVLGASWGDDNNIVFATGEGILQVPATGGKANQLIREDDKKTELFRSPQILKGGKYVLFTVRSGNRTAWLDSQIVVQSLQTGERKILVEDGVDARYVPTGHLVYVKENKLLAVPFDLDRFATTGDPILLVDGVMQGGNTNETAQFCLSEEGTLAYVPGTNSFPKRTLNWVDRQGKVARAIPDLLPMRSFKLSAKELKVAVVVNKNKGESDIWVYDLSGKGAPYPVTSSGTNVEPVWTRDGKQILFRTSARNIKGNLRRIVADGSTLKSEVLLDCSSTCFPLSFGPHNELFYYESGTKVLDPTKGKEPQPLLAELKPFDPMVSPDGRFLAFTSSRTGKEEIWVAEYPDLKGPRRISLNRGTSPRWSPDGRALYYREGNKIMEVSVRLQPTFAHDPAKELFTRNWVNFDYAVTPDGRFLVILDEEQPTETPPAQQVNIVLNWFEELKQKVPTGKK